MGQDSESIAPGAPRSVIDVRGDQLGRLVAVLALVHVLGCVLALGNGTEDERQVDFVDQRLGAVVIGYSQILLEDAEDEGDSEDVADLNKIHSAGQHLLKLVNEVLDLSKIEAGKMEVDLEETDLAELLTRVSTVWGWIEQQQLPP